jgi:hypothetical protein
MIFAFSARKGGSQGLYSSVTRNGEFASQRSETPPMNSSRSALIRDAAIGASVVQPVACAMRVLDEIACPRKGRSLATATGLKTTTVYRYVCAPQQLGYVCFDRRAGGYFLGPRICNLCTEDNSERMLTVISNNPMEWLHKSFPHTVNLARLKGRRIHYQ